jgi:hypothetical protein
MRKDSRRHSKRNKIKKFPDVLLIKPMADAIHYKIEVAIKGIAFQGLRAGLENLNRAISGVSA